MATEEIPYNRKIAFENEPEENEPEENEYYEDETDEDETDEDEDEDEDEDGIVDLLANTLSTPEGDTLCGTLVQISNTLATQNKILIKLLSTLSRR